MSVFSYFINILAVIFWVFRLIVTFTASAGIEIGIVPLDLNVEIILLFTTLISLVFVFKRNLLGAIIYLVIYVMYFGFNAYTTLQLISQGSQGITNYTTFMVSILGVVIAFLTFIDIGLNKNRKSLSGNSKKTDWFYKDGKHEREFDDRADKNQYKF